MPIIFYGKVLFITREYLLPSGYLTQPWKDPPIFQFGKPSISMGHLYHGYVSHNQMVYLCHQYALPCERYFPIFWHGRGPWEPWCGKSARESPGLKHRLIKTWQDWLLLVNVSDQSGNLAIPGRMVEFFLLFLVKLKQMDILHLFAKPVNSFMREASLQQHLFLQQWMTGASPKYGGFKYVLLPSGKLT